ncbi:MAG TPA: glycerate kinase [Candidatus Fimivicinus intestinavium]|nr:glycerate kinase [Candidatus Fimivicinus intestinavium]
MRQQSKKRVLIAPDSFKGTMTAGEVCQIIRAAFLEVDPSLEICCIPMADGGEGTVEAFLSAFGGAQRNARVHGPLFARLEAAFAILRDGTAVIEMAQAAGLTLVEEQSRNPFYTSTYGVGELIRAALDAGCRRILICVGGSGTIDGGLGCLTALGARFLDSHGREVPPMGCGLGQVEHILTNGLDQRLCQTGLTVLCDVDSPLYGDGGAAFAFGRQKGANNGQIRVLDAALRAFAGVVQRDTGRDVGALAGAGAAGGLAGGLAALAGAELSSGSDFLLREMGFDALAQCAALVVTGEGQLDSQSVRGKVVAGVARHSGQTPVVAIAGQVEGIQARLAAALGLTEIYEANVEKKPFSQVKECCREDLHRAALCAARAFLQSEAGK